jgi:hypothetical protein
MLEVEMTKKLRCSVEGQKIHMDKSFCAGYLFQVCYELQEGLFFKRHVSTNLHLRISSLAVYQRGAYCFGSRVILYYIILFYLNHP